uniref:NADH dehydrogenase [ubiquinone] 1 beta subcomplex subunit 4 n=1 Tax=Marmota marmota marmota TaxID=9994 RepID=A0A8C6ESI6_MARMA
MSFPKYKPLRLATLLPTLDPAEYTKYNISPETLKAQAERLAIRAWLKWEYLLQYNDPNRGGDRKEKLIQEGKLDRKFNISY